MADHPDWERDGRDWPNREHSRFVEAGGLRWHVQRAGHGPVLLLIHGTGAGTHSWRSLLPLLAREFDVVAPDLPGHAFTQAPPTAGYALPAMAVAVGALLRALGAAPAVVVGHSAGAAIGARLCLDGHATPRALVSLNGAWLPFGGMAGPWFSAAARVMAALPLLPRVFAWGAADPARVRHLVEQTGSRIDDTGLALYGRLIRHAGHADAGLQMMARWDLVPLQRDLPRLQPALTLVVGEGDLAVPPSQAERVHALLPHSTLTRLPGLGHMAHEEAPEQVAALIIAAARRGAGDGTGCH
jgi:magnesium chelatase accessory protein